MGPSSPNEPRSRFRRGLTRAAALLGLAALSGCIELAIVADVSFPSTVPGLAADQPWVSLPVRRWLTESSIEPVAISACLAPTCRHQAAIGLFRARGEVGAALARAATSPAALVAALTSGRRPTRLARGRTRPVEARISADPAREGGSAGFVMRIARPDGMRAAFGYVAARQAGGAVQAVVIVTTSEEAARALARDVVPALGG